MNTRIEYAPSSANKILKAMLSDMEMQDAVFKPTQFWSNAVDEIVADLEQKGFENFRRFRSTRRFFVASYGPPANMLTERQIEQLEAVLLEHVDAGSKPHLTLRQHLIGDAWAIADYRVFLAGDRPSISPDLSFVNESIVGNPPDGLTIDKRGFSRSFLNYLHGLVFPKQQLGEVGIKTVLEVGGGYGTLGEILNQAGGDYTYIDVDIPPTGAVASYYLRQQEGLDLIDYMETRNVREIRVPKLGQQMVLCPWQLPRLKGRVDLFWNFISFQEMEPDVVKFYLKEAHRLGSRYVLLRNLREGKQRRTDKNAVGVNDPILGEDYDQFLSDYRLVATNVFPFGFQTIDGFHSELRLYELK